MKKVHSNFSISNICSHTERYYGVIKSKSDLGFCIHVQQNGKIIFEQNCGPVCADTSLPISSVSKHFIAAGIDLLGEKIRTKTLKEFFMSPGKYENVIIEDLINHTSGIPEFLFLPSDEEINSWTLEEAVSFIFSLPLNKTPFLYSNSNYVLLSRVIEIVSGIRYDKYIRAKIFDLTKMEKTFSYDELIEDNTFDLNTTYTSRRDSLHPAEVNRGCRGWGDSAFYSSASDLNKWIFSDGFKGHVTKCLSQGSKNQYCGGLFFERHGTLTFHTGSTIGAESLLAYFPNENLSVVYLSNHSLQFSPIPALLEALGVK